MNAPDDAERSSRDALVQCLASAERRRVIRELDERGPSSIEEVAAAVAESGSDGARRIARIELGLHHVHLPKLETAGVVEYDPETATVAPADRIGAASDLVESAERAEQCAGADAGTPSGSPERLDPTVRD